MTSCGARRCSASIWERAGDGGAALADAKQATNTNAFQEKFAWGKSEILDFTGEKGQKLQAGLYYPAGYEPGK